MGTCQRLPPRLFAAVIVIFCCPVLPAQQSDEPVVSPSAPPAGAPDKHMFGVLPNYRTADTSKPFAALSPGQKFTIALHDSFDPPGYFIAAWYTAIYHIENTNPEFGQGLKGYLHRYATTYADQMSGNIMTEGALPSLLREDPRYYRRAHGSIPLRTLWAVSRIFVTRTDRDTYEFNFSEFMGNGVSAGIANAWYPRNRTLGDNLDRLQMQLVSDSISNCLKEFWPDLKRALHLGPRRRLQEREARREPNASLSEKQGSPNLGPELLQHIEPRIGIDQQ